MFANQGTYWTALLCAFTATWSSTRTFISESFSHISLEKQQVLIDAAAVTSMWTNEYPGPSFLPSYFLDLVL
jgi:hypothetical protein